MESVPLQLMMSPRAFALGSAIQRGLCICMVGSSTELNQLDSLLRAHGYRAKPYLDQSDITSILTRLKTFSADTES